MNYVVYIQKIKICLIWLAKPLQKICDKEVIKWVDIYV